MKAYEVLRSYAAGERNFCGKDLHGQSFFREDLSGADFTGANIKQTNFTRANLEGANFTGARAGIQSRCNPIALGFITSAIQTMLIFTGLSSTKINEISSLPEQAIYLIVGFTISLMVASCIIISRLGFTVKSLLVIATAIITAFLIVVLGFSGKSLYVTGVIVILGGVYITVATAISIAIFAIIVFFAMAARSKTIIISSIFTSIIIVLIAKASSKNVGSYGFYDITEFIIYDLFGYYCGYHASKGNNNFGIIRTCGIYLSARFGTSFLGANLTSAIFEKAILQSTNFDNSRYGETNLNKINWKGAEGLDHANFASDSILMNSAVRNLLLTRNGYGKSYVGANLQSANLDGVDLENADLTRANISGATLRKAKLINANLNESIFLNTDLTGAHLTGACLEAWNFDSHTNLTDVKCLYIYLLRKQGECYPSSGKFGSGDFTKLFQKVRDTVDLIFRDGVDSKALELAIREVEVKYGNVQLKVHSFENKDGLLVVRVSIPASLYEYKTDIHHSLMIEVCRLSTELKAKNEELHYHRTKSFSPTTINHYNKPMNNINNIDSSRSVEITGNITGSNINLGEISGNVTNTINQLPDISDPSQPNIKELLTQLQAAIEAETTLTEDNKSDLLEEVKNLAEATQTKETAKKEKLGRKAKIIFYNMLEKLPDTAKVVEACSKLLPLILKVLGVPV